MNANLEDTPSLGQGRQEASMRAWIHSHTVVLSHLEPHSALPQSCSQSCMCLLGHHASRETGEAGGEGTMGNRIRRKQGSSGLYGQTACESQHYVSSSGEAGSPRALQQHLLHYKLGSVVRVFEGCSMLIELRNRHGISKGVARSRHFQKC